ncbi:MAG: aminoacyl-tRNA hydrolase [Oscillospiraceae bacterium]
MLFQKPNYDWLIAGLGNPGPEYEKTRHNTGFMSLDLLAARLQVKVSKERFKALTAQADFDGQRLLLMKPQTYMNASGIAIEAAAHFYKIPPERVLVLFDDISLPVGKLRIRKNGSAGGHNGLKSIISCLGSDQFPRVKIGVGAKPHPDYDLADWVLSTVSKTEWPDYQEAMSHAGDAALCIVKNGCEKAAAEYNGKMF